MVSAWRDANADAADELDQQRLYAIARGDTTAFTELFQAYAVALVNAAYRIVRDSAVAEDLVQDVYLSVWRAGPSLRVMGSVRGYLYGAVRNSALKWLRHQGVEQRWLRQSTELTVESNTSSRHHASVPLASAPLVTAQFDAKELDARVRAAIDQLPPQAREIFLLRWSEQMTYAEIAAALGLAVKTVENHIGRALKVLRRLLEADRSDWG